MRSTVSIKGMALALVIFFIGASLFCYLFLYRPKINKATKGKRELASLTGTVDKKMEELDKIQREVERYRVSIKVLTPDGEVRNLM